MSSNSVSVPTPLQNTFGSNSVLGNWEHSQTHITDATDPSAIAKNPMMWIFSPGKALTSMAYLKSQQNTMPDLATAPAPPSTANATEGALENQLRLEGQMRQSQTGPGYSGSMLDGGQPAVASRVLLGV